MLEILKINRRNIISYLIIFTFSLILFAAWLGGHYATDTYTIIERGYENYAIMNSLKDARPVMAIIMFIAEFIKLDVIKIVQITLIASIAICSGVVLYLKNIILQKIDKKSILSEIFITIASYITIFNFMFLENIYYMECAVMSLSILLNLIAANILIKQGKMCFLKSLILVIIATMCYQGTVNFFITVVLFLACISFERKDKEIIKNLILGAIIWAISIISNYAFMIIVKDMLQASSGRAITLNNIGYNYIYIINHIPKMLTYTNFYFPKYLFLINILLVVGGGIGYYLIKEKDYKYKILHIILICLVAYFSCFATSLVTLSSFGSSRMMFSIGALIGILILYYLTNVREQNIFKLVCNGILVIYSLITISVYYNKINAQVEINKSDIEWTKKVDELIKEYEQENDKKIKYIAFSKDTNCYIYYNNIYTTALEDSSIEPTWSRVGLINYWTDRDLKEIKISEEIYNQYFKDKNWDEFSEEQCVFIDETFYYCIY